jgi:mannose-1-phosphate guanylyltransferase
MRRDDSLWAILLAAGQGTRVRNLTRGAGGESIPKQFWAPDGRHSMLRRTMNRIQRLVPKRRIMVVVVEEHSRWWADQVADIPSEHLMVQPCDRGTGPGVLLPLLHVLDRDPTATIALFPCDHEIRHERVLWSAITRSRELVRRREAEAVLLGMVPEEVPDDCGWIVPVSGDPRRAGRRVARIVEKPEPATAEELRRRGALVNSMMLVAHGPALARITAMAQPSLMHRFRTWQQADGNPSGLRTLYGTLPRVDFTRDVLEPSTASLSVLPVRPCGWSDLGIPTRLERFLGAPASSPPALAPLAAWETS